MDMDMEMDMDVGFSVSDGTSHPFPTTSPTMRPACSPSKTKKNLNRLGLPSGYFQREPEVGTGGKSPPSQRSSPLTGTPFSFDSQR